MTMATQEQSQGSRQRRRQPGSTRHRESRADYRSAEHRPRGRVRPLSPTPQAPLERRRCRAPPHPRVPQEAAENVEEAADELAERAQALGGDAHRQRPGSGEHATVEPEDRTSTTSAPRSNDLEMYGDIIESYREHIELAAGLGDHATAHMLPSNSSKSKNTPTSSTTTSKTTRSFSKRGRRRRVGGRRFRSDVRR